jgi:hypothetical protein
MLDAEVSNGASPCKVGGHRALGRKYSSDFFVQRAYQDSFRHKRWLAEENDRALAMYRAHPSDPLSRCYEAHPLLFAEPRRAQETFNDLIKANPEFPWPHDDHPPSPPGASNPHGAPRHREH